MVKRLLLTLLVLLPTSVAMAQLPSDTCVITGTIYNGDASLAAYTPVTILKVVKSGKVIYAGAHSDTSDANGSIYIRTWRNSTITLYSPCRGLNAIGGTNLQVPDLASCSLESLLPATTVPTSYIVAVPLMYVGTSGSVSQTDTLVFSGATASTTFKTTTITVTGGSGDTTGVNAARLARIEADLGQFTAAASDSLHRADSLATLARDSVARARLDIAAHAARTDNPHSVTAGQIGALAVESDPSVDGKISDTLDVNARGYATETWVVNQSYLTAFTESDPIASAAASTALDTASTARQDLANHAARTDNPHTVTAAQLGALTAETDPLAVLEADTAATINDRAHTWTAEQRVAVNVPSNGEYHSWPVKIIDTTAAKWTHRYKAYPFTNGPTGSTDYYDQVYTWGWNVARPVTTEPELAYQLEQKFYNSAPPWLIEAHLNATGINGQANRWFTAAGERSTGHNTQWTFNVGLFQIMDSSGLRSNNFRLDPYSRTIDLDSGYVWRFNHPSSTLVYAHNNTGLQSLISTSTTTATFGGLGWTTAAKLVSGTHYIDLQGTNGKCQVTTSTFSGTAGDSANIARKGYVDTRIATLTNLFFPLDSIKAYWWTTDTGSIGKKLELQFARSGGALLDTLKLMSMNRDDSLIYGSKSFKGPVTIQSSWTASHGRPTFGFYEDGDFDIGMARNDAYGYYVGTQHTLVPNSLVLMSDLSTTVNIKAPNSQVRFLGYNRMDQCIINVGKRSGDTEPPRKLGTAAINTRSVYCDTCDIDVAIIDSATANNITTALLTSTAAAVSGQADIAAGDSVNITITGVALTDDITLAYVGGRTTVSAGETTLGWTVYATNTLTVWGVAGRRVSYVRVK